MTDPIMLWKNQPTEIKTMSLTEIQTRARKFQSQIFWRNLREYIATFAVCVIFGVFAARSDNTWLRLGCLLIIAAALFVSAFLFLNGRSNRSVAPDAAACHDFHREALLRQRNLLRGVWLWYLAPFLPGLILFMWGQGQQEGVTLLRSGLVAGFVAFVFLGIGLLNQWAARRLQKEIDRLG